MPLADNFGGTTTYDFRPGRGNYCGSLTEAGYATFLNEQEGASAYVNANLQLGDNAELYASLLYSDNTDRIQQWLTFLGAGCQWIPLVIIWDDRLAEPLIQYQHIFSPEETGGRNTNNDINKSQSYNVALGVRGAFGDSTWEYDAYYAVPSTTWRTARSGR